MRIVLESRHLTNYKVIKEKYKWATYLNYFESVGSQIENFL